MTASRAALLTTSCTHALEMMALLLDVQPGDEVIVPTFTFVSTANAFVLRGARPVFCDSRADTLNLNDAALDSLITSRTKAIVVVHYAGVGCEMDAILSLASARGIPVVEDNAHGLLGTYRGRPLGSFGALAAQSFHETKNFSCGEGGALIVNDDRYSDRAEIIREKGTNRSQFFRGEIDKYTWVDVGSSYLPSEILAAFLVAQLEAAEEIQRLRRQLWMRYAEGLAEWSRAGGRDAALRAASLRAALPHVLPADADARGTHCIHVDAAGQEHPRGISLRPAAHLSGWDSPSALVPGNAPSPNPRPSAWSGCRSTRA